MTGSAPGGAATRLVASGLAVRRGPCLVLDGVDLAVQGGEVLGLIGPNGAGKTTLLRALAGLSEAERGEVTLDGAALMSIDRRIRARRVAFLQQDGTSAWPMRAAAVVALGRIPHRDPWRRPAATDAAAIEAAMAATGVAGFAERSVDTLSSGERLRVFLARALAVEPAVLLADEPVAALDPYHQLAVMELLRSQAGQGRAVVVVLHDLALAARFCHRLALLHGGRIVKAGAPAEVLTDEATASVYRVRLARSQRPDGAMILPWERLDP